MKDGEITITRDAGRKEEEETYSEGHIKRRKGWSDK